MKSVESLVAGKNKKILIIDDEVSIIDAITAAFEMVEGYALETATSFAEYEGRRGVQPDIILLDVRIGNQDGKQIAKKIKNTHNIKDIPLIMMSGLPGVEEHCLKAGADDFLEKPFSVSELLVTVNKHLVSN